MCGIVRSSGLRPFLDWRAAPQAARGCCCQRKLLQLIALSCKARERIGSRGQASLSPCTDVIRYGASRGRASALLLTGYCGYQGSKIRSSRIRSVRMRWCCALGAVCSSQLRPTRRARGTPGVLRDVGLLPLGCIALSVPMVHKRVARTALQQRGAAIDVRDGLRVCGAGSGRLRGPQCSAGLRSAGRSSRRHLRSSGLRPTSLDKRSSQATQLR